MGFEALVVDFGGVLCTSPFHAIRRYEDELGVPHGPVAELLFGASYTFGHGDGEEEHDWHLVETGRMGLADYVTRLHERSRDRFGDRLVLDLGRALGGDTGVYWEMVHHLRRVKARGYPTAILTNNVREYGDGWKRLVPLDEITDVVVDSSAEGIRKPHPDIYLRTATRLGVEPAACIFLDDVPENIEGARRVGMHGILVAEPVADAIAEVEALLGPGVA
jgi:putative hydrolase of the HAD superfamily